MSRARRFSASESPQIPPPTIAMVMLASFPRPAKRGEGAGRAIARSAGEGQFRTPASAPHPARHARHPDRGAGRLLRDPLPQGERVTEPVAPYWRNNVAERPRDVAGDADDE